MALPVVGLRVGNLKRFMTAVPLGIWLPVAVGSVYDCFQGYVGRALVGEAGSHLGELALLRHPVELSWVVSFSEPVLVETGVVKLGALVESFLGLSLPWGELTLEQRGNCAAGHGFFCTRSEYRGQWPAVSGAFSVIFGVSQLSRDRLVCNCLAISAEILAFIV